MLLSLVSIAVFAIPHAGEHGYDQSPSQGPVGKPVSGKDAGKPVVDDCESEKDKQPQTGAEQPKGQDKPEQQNGADQPKGKDESEQSSGADQPKAADQGSEAEKPSGQSESQESPEQNGSYGSQDSSEEGYEQDGGYDSEDHSEPTSVSEVDSPEQGPKDYPSSTGSEVPLATESALVDTGYLANSAATAGFSLVAALAFIAL